MGGGENGRHLESMGFIRALSSRSSQLCLPEPHRKIEKEVEVC